MPLLQTRTAAEQTGAEEHSYTVEGYASTFEPYQMGEVDGITYYERIDPHAFDKADMSDVLFLYNHEGRVYARQKNGSLELSVDDHGLKVSADLSRTELARGMYEDIAAGMIDQMSFAFTVADQRLEKDGDTRTRVITRMAKLYDVSAVSVPANPTTAISARSWIDGVIDAERAERLEAEQREEQKERIRSLLGGMTND